MKKKPYWYWPAIGKIAGWSVMLLAAVFAVVINYIDRDTGDVLISLLICGYAVHNGWRNWRQLQANLRHEKRRTFVEQFGHSVGKEVEKALKKDPIVSGEKYGVDFAPGVRITGMILDEKPLDDEKPTATEAKMNVGPDPKAPGQLCVDCKQHPCACGKQNYWGHAPKNLDEAIDMLLAMKGADGWAKTPEGEARASTHFNVGRTVRNRWGMWQKDSPLATWFRETHGITHADDMSAIIFTSAHRMANGKPLDVAGQVKRCLEYWANVEKNRGPRP